MKKLTAVLIALAICIMALAGCGSKDSGLHADIRHRMRT